jgi:hypothetical protein
MSRSFRDDGSSLGIPLGEGSSIRELAVGIVVQ